MVWSNAQHSKIASVPSFGCDWTLGMAPRQAPLTCPSPSSSAPWSWPPTPTVHYHCHEDIEAPTSPPGNLDVHAPSICQHPNCSDEDAVTLNFVKCFLHRPQKRRRPAETQMQVQNQQRPGPLLATGRKSQRQWSLPFTGQENVSHSWLRQNEPVPEPDGPLYLNEQVKSPTVTCTRWDLIFPYDSCLFVKGTWKQLRQESSHGLLRSGLEKDGLARSCFRRGLWPSGAVCTTSLKHWALLSSSPSSSLYPPPSLPSSTPAHL